MSPGIWEYLKARLKIFDYISRLDPLRVKIHFPSIHQRLELPPPILLKQTSWLSDSSRLFQIRFVSSIIFPLRQIDVRHQFPTWFSWHVTPLQAQMTNVKRYTISRLSSRMWDSILLMLCRATILQWPDRPPLWSTVSISQRFTPRGLGWVIVLQGPWPNPFPFHQLTYRPLGNVILPPLPRIYIDSILLIHNDWIPLL